MIKSLFVTKWRFIVCSLVICFALGFFGSTKFCKYFIPAVHNPAHHSLPALDNLPAEFCKLLRSEKVFLLEPYFLARVHAANGTTNKTVEKLKKDEITWRFDLQDNWDKWQANSLTVGVFAEQMGQEPNLAPFKETHRITGPCDPFNATCTNTLHVFYESASNQTNGTLHLHLVVLHRVKYFHYIGAISDEIQTQLNTTALHFGASFPQIYDPIEVTTIEGLAVPDSAGHVLSQMQTARYLHSSPELADQWMAKNNIAVDPKMVQYSIEAVIAMKGLMREMQMEFWLAAGTLLGWYRQGSIIPYTSDNDFATWSAYAKKNNDLAAEIIKCATRHNLQLKIIMGEPQTCIEFSFITLSSGWKVDLFFNYQNVKNFRFPLHGDGGYTFQYFPKYKLCSAELHGYKVLTPCIPQEVIETEFGLEWRQPVREWNYMNSPHNVEIASYPAPPVKWL